MAKAEKKVRNGKVNERLSNIKSDVWIYGSVLCSDVQKVGDPITHDGTGEYQKSPQII